MMGPVTLESLAERVATLERELAELRGAPPRPGRFKDWRRAVGMFPNNEFQKQIDEAGREIRESDRREATP